ncbi:MAG: DNA internalization-related competence protein ComEC/Rec2 [Christensenellales bacterium]|jgi:competence protein ComEC
MKEMRLFFGKRPLMCAVLAFALGIALAGKFSESFYLVLAIAAAAAAICIFINFSNFNNKKSFTLCVLAFFAAFALGFTRTSIVLEDVIEIDRSGVQVRATIDRVLREDRLVVSKITADGVEIRGKSLVAVYSNSPDELPEFLPGQTIDIEKSRIFTPMERTMPYGFSYMEYAMYNGARLSITASVGDISLSGGRSLLIGNAQLIRNRLGSLIDEVYGENSGIVKALIIGARDELDEATLENFRKSGVVHVLSLSGLHANIIAFIIMLLVGRLPLNFSARRMLAVLALFTYCMVAGMSPSIIRAVIMSACLFGGKIVRRESDALTSLSLAAFIILLVNPTALLYSISFQLSFMAVAGIALLNRPLLKLMRGENNLILNAAALTVSAQLGVLPLMAYYFHEVSIVGIVANILVVPVISLVLIASIATLMLALVLPLSVVSFIAGGSVALFALASYISAVFAWLPFSTVKVHAPGFISFFLYYSAIIIRLDKKEAKIAARLILAALSLILFVIKPAIERPNEFTMVSFDVGNGDATLLRNSDAAVLIDCGEESAGLYHSIAGQGIVLDAFVLTHGHDDHGGGLKKLVEYAKVKSIVLWHGADFTQYSPMTLEALALAADRGIPIELVGEGDILTKGEISLEILWPIYRTEDENDNSLMILAESDSHRVMLTGDAGFLPEVYAGARADVLKVGHHGSKYSTSSEFLEKVMPKYAVISVGRNSHGHPTPQTIQRLEEKGAAVMTTLDNGTITFSFKGEGEIEISAYGENGPREIKELIEK